MPVIGAAGGIGRTLVRELAADSAPDQGKVRAAVRRPDAAESLRRHGVETAFLDLGGTARWPLARSTPLLDAFAGVDRVFLLTGYTVEMLAQSKAVIDAVRLTGVTHVVHLGPRAVCRTTRALGVSCAWGDGPPERRAILAVLEHAKGSRMCAVALVGITRSQVLPRLSRLAVAASAAV